MNDLELLYASIESKGRAAIQSGNEFIDENLNHMEQDHRLALTLLISLRGPIVNKLRLLEQEIRAVEPQQYYYPDADMHVTLIELICSTPTFTRDEAVIQQGVEIIEEAIRNLEPFDIAFNGIIASNGAILARGYYQDGVLALRESVRKVAKQR
ncbi:TPA: hypothetical protein DDW35_09465, partial [Candidatus Sumerlaeota bacterium]|nr:hypothetical protein [Candidatus Sumerlaeota bacterium]